MFVRYIHLNPVRSGSQTSASNERTNHWTNANSSTMATASLRIVLFLSLRHAAARTMATAGSSEMVNLMLQLAELLKETNSAKGTQIHSPRSQTTKPEASGAAARWQG